MDTNICHTFRMYGAVIAAAFCALLAVVPGVCMSPQPSAKEAGEMAALHQAGLNKDRSQIPALLAALQKPDDPIKRSYAFVALYTLALPQSLHAQQLLYGRPARLRSLADLNLLENNDLAASQKTEVLLSWLAEERNNPSPTMVGHGGGPIDTNYLQAQIIKTLETKGDPLAVGWVATSTSLKDQSTRDGMRLVLGFMGDKSQTPALEKILLGNQNPYLRAMAAEDLGLLGAVSSLPTLKSARKDTFSVTFASERNDGKLATFYPVRQVVEETLNILSKPALLAQEKQRGQFFASRLVEARKYAQAHNLSPSHFVRIANRSKALVRRSPGT